MKGKIEKCIELQIGPYENSHVSKDISTTVLGGILTALAAPHFSSHFPSPIPNFKTPHLLQSAGMLGQTQGVSKTPMPAHLEIFSNEQGPRKAAIGI